MDATEAQYTPRFAGEMVKVLLLGCSDIASRRVLPALWSVGVRDVEVASISKPAVEWPGGRLERRYATYQDAIATSRADLVYVSTVNSTHVEWTLKALEAGRHVAVDKPAALTLDDARRLVDTARRADRCLAEATVYGYHPRIAKAASLFAELGSRPTHVGAAFSFPPLPATNFRTKRALGGGTVYDLGPYAITLGRLFFDEVPAEVVGRVHATNGEVDTEFSLVASYPGGRSVVGTFGMTTGYVNRVDVLGPGLVLSMERFFSPPPTAVTDILVRRPAGAETVTIEPADPFARFLEEVTGAMGEGRSGHQRLAARLLADAEALDALRRSAGLA